jgi:hypothetical protein
MPVLKTPPSPPRFRLPPAACSVLVCAEDPTLTGYLYHNALGVNCARKGRIVNKMVVIHTTQRYVRSDVVNTYAAGLSDTSKLYANNHYEVVDSSCSGAYLVMVNTLLCEDTPIISNGAADGESTVKIQTIVTGQDSYGFRFEEVFWA